MPIATIRPLILVVTITTNVSDYIMHYYRKPKLPIEVDLERKKQSSEICEEPAQDADTLLYYGEKMAKLKDVIYNRAKRNIDAAQSEYKQQYDRKHCDNRVGIM